MKHDNVINKIIPADDLHWCEEDQKYTSLSMEELDSIIINCVDQGITNLEEISKVVTWAGFVKVGNLLLKNFLTNRLAITGFDSDDEPLFGAKEDDLNRENG